MVDLSDLEDLTGTRIKKKRNPWNKINPNRVKPDKEFILAKHPKKRQATQSEIDKRQIYGYILEWVENNIDSQKMRRSSKRRVADLTYKEVIRKAEQGIPSDKQSIAKTAISIAY